MMSYYSQPGSIGAGELHSSSLQSRGTNWDRIFLWLVGTLSATILLKIAQIQYLEIIYFVQILILLASSNDYTVRIVPAYWFLAKQYLIFVTVALALSIYATKRDFYYPDELSTLKLPVVITVSRILELLASMVALLYIASRIRSNLKDGRLVVRVYFWTGALSAVYSILSYPLHVAGIASLGTYLGSNRMRGFYNEGGPYGLYLISVFLVGIALYTLQWENRRRLMLAAIPLGMAFLGSQSKAAFIAVLAILLINGLLVKSFVQRFVLITALGAFLIAAYQVVDLAKAVRLYQTLSQAYERASHRNAENPNFVYGRIAGAFLVPRMIAAHPFTGIGWGNYGIVRNDPEYRGASALVRGADDPGLGLLGTMADLGVPLTLFLVFILLLPFLLLRRRKAPLYMTNLALLQPIVHLFGGQLNLTYPWVITAFALGLAYSPVLAESVRSGEQR